MLLYQHGTISKLSHFSPTFGSVWGLELVDAINATCAVLFILVLPFRLRKLQRVNIKASWDWQGPLKFVLSICLSIIALAQLIYSKTYEVTTLISVIVSLIASSGLGLLLLVEQYRSIRPSTLGTLYLFTSIFHDTILLTFPDNHGNASLLVIARWSISFLLLLLECNKRPSTTFIEDVSPEHRSGFLGMIFFIWINSILLRGYRKILAIQDLPHLSQDMRPEVTRRNILRVWELRSKPEGKRSLPLALFRSLKWPFIAAIVPRLALITFRYCQPVLIKDSIKFVISTQKMSPDHGYWLVVSAVVTYVGLAVSISMYQHRLNMLRLLIKSSLVGLIHEKTMSSPSISYDNGESTTLMSTDADSLEEIAEMFHETWAQLLEVAIGMVLLAGEVGWIWPLPLVLIFLCSRVSRYVAKHLQSRQKAWNDATQNRVAATSSMLGSMKTIKMLGYQDYLTNRILNLRSEELSVAAGLRWVMVYYNASANALGIFTPAITLVLYTIIAAIQGQKLDTETAFTTMAILGLVTHPANMVMTIVPRAIGTLAAFDRIQTFLLRPSLPDYRIIIDNKSTLIETDPKPAVLIRNLGIGTKQYFLKSISLEVTANSFVIISGPVGCGKSSLLRSILGEMPPSHGTIQLTSRRIAYCGQKPWLPSGSIREAIQGHTQTCDESFYQEVVKKCCLSHDFDSLPQGDETQIGSRGLNLSGGQRQRITLARAIFARYDIILLDDSLSGLDGETEQQIFEGLFGSDGIFKALKTAVVFVTNSTQYFQAADKVVILGNNGIQEQGSWQDIRFKTSSISKFEPSVQKNKTSTAFDKLGAQLRASDEAEVDLSRQTGDTALYAYYARSAGLLNVLLYVCLTSVYSFCITAPQYWLQLWTSSGSSDATFFICGFLLLAFASWSSTSAGVWATQIRLAPRSGIRLHKSLLHTVANAPLSFFSGTDNGSILNRFSQDIQLIDKQLPSAFSRLFVQTTKLLMQSILLSITQWWLAMLLPICLLVLWVIQKVYLRTSRQLRFLELESRADVFSSFLETIEGIETVRSFNWHQHIISSNIHRVETSQRPEFLLLCLQRWLNIVLDILAAAIATSVVATAVYFRGQITGGQVGVALNIMLVSNTTLLKLVEVWTQLEVSLGAVARVRNLEMVTPAEGAGDIFEPPDNWPSKGRLELDHVTASYNVDVVALRNINLKIEAGQKIVICGRTGSGKSSLLLALLGILELQKGTIEIDGIDISRINLNILRQRCFITVSQDALLLPNDTLRQNLDHDATISDEIILDSLTQVGLHTHFLGPEPDVSILNHPLSSLPQLSTGQSQLFSLCRGILRAKYLRAKGIKPIILLDEVTSSLDYDTEASMYRAIDKEFVGNGHTVLVIAHRMGVLGDRVSSQESVVMSMSDGRVESVEEM